MAINKMAYKDFHLKGNAENRLGLNVGNILQRPSSWTPMPCQNWTAYIFPSSSLMTNSPKILKVIVRCELGIASFHQASARMSFSFLRAAEEFCGAPDASGN
jgi:hypothetical protein